tara:strand:+ start:23 stop:226 length:204 start_codon:yes stop_codon:yes gene_type:complete
MTKKFYALIEIVDDDEATNISKYQIIVNKKGKRIPCGFCNKEEELPYMKLVENVDDDQHDNLPYIAF